MSARLFRPSGFSPDWTRRSFLRGAGAAVAWAASGCVPPPSGPLPPRFTADPFSLGVASGCPRPDGVVLWTRLAPAPREPGGGLPPETFPVTWRLAEDPGLVRVVRQGVAPALPGLGHSVHIEVRGLAPDRRYWYRFECGDAQSPIGRTRTAPLPGSALQNFRFAYASCQNFERGYFSGYRHMLKDDLDLVIHLGDYIYESGVAEGAVRSHEASEPMTLDDYRVRHALYKTDPDLQAAHAAYPWLMTWDDHEVENDYAGDVSQDGVDPSVFRERRVAAYRAYYENMPISRDALVTGGAARLYGRYGFGDLVDVSVLDGRQYRDDQPCGGGAPGGGRVVEDCEARLTDRPTMLGDAQESWLLEGLARSPVRWKVIAQQQLMAELDQKPGPGTAYWTDGWDGYAGQRERILAAIGARGTANVVVIAGDVHSFWANELRTAPGKDRQPPVAVEFVGTSITSNGVPYETFAELLPENPHVKFFESRRRGYVLCEVTPERWRTDFRVVDTITAPESRVDTLASFTVENGLPGIAGVDIP
jgi:alkaline phosphatase D